MKKLVLGTMIFLAMPLLAVAQEQTLSNMKIEGGNLQTVSLSGYPYSLNKAAICKAMCFAKAGCIAWHMDTGTTCKLKKTVSFSAYGFKYQNGHVSGTVTR